MNKNDFYKELMSQYALDPEKIRMNALKQAKKPAWQRVVGDYWKPAVGAAAAVAVTVAGVSYANQSSAPSITVEPNEVLSASQRLIEAEQNYYNAQDDEYFSDIYVTFIEPVSYNELTMALSTVTDPGEFQLSTLYTADDKLDGQEISDFIAETPDSRTAIAAKLSLPASYYRDIQDLSIVYLAELGSAEINDDTFTPIAVEDDDPLDGDFMNIVTSTTEKPVVTTTPFSFDAVTEPDKEDAPVIGESGNDDIITTLPPETEEEYEESEDPIDVETPEITTIATSAPETTPTETTTTYYRGDVGLLTEIYELNVQNSLETHIAGNNVVVLTKDEAYLYTLGGFSSHQSGELISISNPKLAYKGDDRIILTGCRENGTRGIISVIDLDNDTVYTYDASANIGECEIGSFQYSDENGKFFMKAVSAESTLIYELTLDIGITFRPLAEIEAPVSLAGYKNGILYFTILENGDITRLYSFNCNNGASVELAAFNGTVKIKRGADFSSFAILAPDEATSFILDANLGMLVPAQFDETVTVITDSGETFFRTNGLVYKIDSTSNVVDADRSVEFEKNEVENFIVNEINSEKVVVVYNDDNVW